LNATNIKCCANVPNEQYECVWGVENENDFCDLANTAGGSLKA
jgi:hypothetical protein